MDTTRETLVRWDVLGNLFLSERQQGCGLADEPSVTTSHQVLGTQRVDVTQSSKRIKFSEENWELGQDAQNCFAHLQLDPQIS